MAVLCLKSSGTMLKFLKPSRSLLPPTNVLINKINPMYINTNTLDLEDMKYLAKFASVWWDPEGQMKPLHKFNTIRVPFIRDSLVTMSPDTPSSTSLRGKKILEVGCGAGILAEVRPLYFGYYKDLAKLGADLTGIDPTKELLQVAVEHAGFNTNLTNKPKYFNTTIEEHVKEHSNKYDAVIASEVIEHINISQRELFVESCVKALKPGGKIIFTTPNRTRMSQLLGIYLVEALNVIPRGAHHYNKFVTQEELKYLLELNDCRVDLVQGYVYYFWSGTWKWIKWQGLMYAMRAIKLDNKTV